MQTLESLDHAHGWLSPLHPDSPRFIYPPIPDDAPDLTLFEAVAHDILTDLAIPLHSDNTSGNLFASLAFQAASTHQELLRHAAQVSVHSASELSPNDLRELIRHTTAQHMRQYLFALLSSNLLPPDSLGFPTPAETQRSIALARASYADRSIQPLRVPDIAAYNRALIACSTDRYYLGARPGQSVGQASTSRRLHDMSAAYASAAGADADPDLAFAVAKRV
jgi:hypothetical protein